MEDASCPRVNSEFKAMLFIRSLLLGSSITHSCIRFRSQVKLGRSLINFRGALLLLALGLAVGAQNPRQGIDPDSLPVWMGSSSPDSTVFRSPASDTTFSHLVTQGSKSFQVHVGDGGADVNQELRLMVTGEASPGIFVDARLTDVGRSGGEQVTATLQEGDEMYFRIEGVHGFLQLGNQNWNLNRMGLLGIQKSNLGVSAGIRGQHAEIKGLYGVDETQRIITIFNGNAGQRKGYVLAPGQSGFLVVVPQSVQVYWNGSRLREGLDYQLNEAGGVLDFLGRYIPTPSDEIRVEYDAYTQGNIQQLALVESSYRSQRIWLDWAGFQLASDTARLRRSQWTESDQDALRQDSGGIGGVQGDSGALNRPKSMERVGARIRYLGARGALVDAEGAWQQADSNILSSQVQGPKGRAFRWLASTDTSLNQKFSRIQLEVSGDLREVGYNGAAFQGSDRSWDSYVLRDEWDLDSSGLDGGMRLDAVAFQLRLPGGWYPGGYQGYRRSLSDSNSWNSLRSKGFLRHIGADVESELALERVVSEQKISSERWQGDLEARYVKGVWRPFAQGRVALWQTDVDSDSLVRLQSGLEWGREGSSAYARGELLGEQRDSIDVAQWTQNLDLRSSGWGLQHLFQYRQSQSDSTGTEETWIWENDGSFGTAQSAVKGDVSYHLGYTSEVPWERLYESVPQGTGDVLYDSLANEYIEGVDNGDYVFIGVGRSDSAQAVRTSKGHVKWNMDLALGPLFQVYQGVLSDLSVGFRGDWEAWDSLQGVVFHPPLWRSQLRRRQEGHTSVEGVLHWIHGGGWGSAEFRRGEADEKKAGLYGVWQENRWWFGDFRYTGRSTEIWGGTVKLEEVQRRSVLDLSWNIGELGLSWRKNLTEFFAVEPVARQRYSDGGDGFDSYQAQLTQVGINGYWSDHHGNSAFIKMAWVRMQTEATVLPYAVMEGFGKGDTWRGEARVEWAVQDHFHFTLGYIIRGGGAESQMFQKFSSEAKAMF